MAATAESAVKWIGNLAVEEAKFLYRVKGKVEELQDELKWMTCFLQDVDAKRDRDARVREWINQIIWMAYEAEDIIESFILKVEGNRRSGLMNKLKRYACFIRELILIHKVGSDIDALMLKISKLTSRLQTYGIKPITEYDSPSFRRETLLRKSYAHYIQDEKYIVGMDKHVTVVVNQLLKKNDADGTESRAVAIWGMGGLGKTTLAKKVYGQSDVRQYFEAFAWACISQQCQIKSVLVELVRCLTSEKVDDTWTSPKLMETVHKVQRDKKCLVVLDDIWRIEDWDTLKEAFPNNSKSGGKLILTTRIQSTAERLNLGAFTYELAFMTDTEAWILLERKLGHDPSNIFGKDYVDEMKKLVEEMLKRCGGLPMAIVALGGVLATKKTVDEWRTTHANVKSFLPNAKGGGQSPKEALELSYYDLPIYLKPCFLYLGLFAEDAEIPVRKLVHLWVAEGFISTSFNEDYMVQEGSLEEVAETYLAELVDRSLVQVVSTTKSGRIKRCQIHDLVRDVCLSEASKENFLKVVVADGSKQHSTSSSLIGINTRCRRLAIHEKGGVHWPKILEDCASNNGIDARHINSLFIREDRNLPIRGQDSLARKVVKQFKSLRVLDLDRVRVKALPMEVGDLVHLRYLSIRGSSIFILPSSIENLKSLITLDLSVGFANLPFVIWIRMRQLRHLYMPKGWTVKDSRKEKCRYTFDRLYTLTPKDRMINTMLETIKNVHPSDTKYLAHCSNLRKLRFHKSLHMDKEGLEHMTNPQSRFRGCLERLRLKVEWEVATGLADAFADFVHLNSMQLDICNRSRDGITSLESGMLHDCITTLTIAGTYIENTDAMQVLERLPNLRELILGTNSYIGKYMTCSKQGFTKLTFLGLKRLNDLEMWTIEEGAMLSLQKLEIMCCPNLGMIPDGMKFIRSLQVLNLDLMPESFTDTVSKKSETMEEGDGEDDGLAKQVRGVDFHKVEHIPYVSIDGRQVRGVDFHKVQRKAFLYVAIINTIGLRSMTARAVLFVLIFFSIFVFCFLLFVLRLSV